MVSELRTVANRAKSIKGFDVNKMIFGKIGVSSKGLNELETDLGKQIKQKQEENVKKVEQASDVKKTIDISV